MNKILKEISFKARFYHNKHQRKLVNSLINMVMLVLCGQFIVPAMANGVDSRQSQLFSNNCVQCHTQADTGAPVIGVDSDWVEIKEKSEDEVLKNVIQGIRGMPPLGYCSACSKEDLRILIRLMTNTLEQKRAK